METPTLYFGRGLCAFLLTAVFGIDAPSVIGERPSSNQQYWDQKVQINMARDRLATRELKKRGWRVLRIWEHQLSDAARGRLLWRLRLFGLVG